MSQARTQPVCTHSISLYSLNQLQSVLTYARGRTSHGHCFLDGQLALVLALGVAYCRAFALVLLPQAGRVAPLKEDIHPGVDAVVHLPAYVTQSAVSSQEGVRREQSGGKPSCMPFSCIDCIA